MDLQVSTIENKIYEIRGRRVMLDVDLAEMYGVETRALKQAVRRNVERFPDDFMFRLSSDEANYLINIGRSQNVIPHGYNIGSSEMFAFTQEGASMLSGVLRSPIAVQANINIMRAFVAVREYLLTRASESVEIAQLRERVLLLERLTDDNTKAINENIEAINDLSEDTGKEFETIYDAIGALSIKLPKIEEPRRPIGYKRKFEQ